MANLNFNANEVDPSQGFDPIPAGMYLAKITDSEMRETKAKTGHYLSLTFEICEGQFKGRKLWENLNLDNPNPKAVSIARADLSAICRAVNVMQPQDSVELHDLPMAVKVVVSDKDDRGQPQNEIKSYKPKGELLAGTAPKSAATAAKKPWER